MPDLTWNSSYGSTPGRYVFDFLQANQTLKETLAALVTLPFEDSAPARHRYLRGFEEALTEAVCREVNYRVTSSLLPPLGPASLTFLGFSFRGRFVTGGRHDAIVCRLIDRESSVPEGLLVDEQWRSLKRRLLSVYLATFGMPYSANQLVLEREKDAGHHRCVQLVFGPSSTVNPITDDQKGLRRLVLPKTDIDLLCPSEAETRYREVIRKVQKDDLAGVKRDADSYARPLHESGLPAQLESARQLLIQSWLFGKGSASTEVADFLEYCGAEAAYRRGRLLDHLDDWIRGVQAYTFFRHQWGVFWHTFPISSNTLPDVAFVKYFPACTLTVISEELLNDDASSAIVNLLADIFTYLPTVLTGHEDVYKTFNDAAVRAANKACIAVDVKVERPDRVRVLEGIVPRLAGTDPGFSQVGILTLILLAERLAHENIEGKSLRLRVLYCTPYELLSNVSGARGLLHEILTFEIQGRTIPAFGIVSEHASLLDYVVQLSNSILANGYLLEEAGVVLVFVTSEQHGIEPFGIARLRRRDDAEGQLRGLSAKCPGSVVIQVEQSSAVLHMRGAPVARFEDARGQWRTEAGVGTDEEFLFDVIHGFARQEVLGFDLVEESCRRLTRALIRVRNDRRGALVYLSTNEAPPQTDERVRFSLRSELEEAQQAPREHGCRSTSPVHQRQTLAAWRSGASPPLIPTQKTKDILGRRRAQGTGP